MIIHPLIAGSVLLVALAACNGVKELAADQIREQAVVRTAESPWFADAQSHGFERAWRAAARE